MKRNVDKMAHMRRCSSIGIDWPAAAEVPRTFQSSLYPTAVKIWGTVTLTVRLLLGMQRRDSGH